MAKINALKISLGSFFTLFGLYLVFYNQENFVSAILGFAAIALGIGLIISN